MFRGLNGVGISDGKLLEVNARKFGRSKKVPDWSRDGGDKFYSLTEDSEATSSGCNQSAAEGSAPSESESAWSAAESKVRPQQQQRRCIKARSCSIGGVEHSGQSTKALKWDYLGTRLMGLEQDSKLDPLPSIDGGEDCQVPSNSVTGTDAKMLQMIYDTIRELQTELRAKSRRARIATKHLQGAVHKVVKSCTEIEEKLSAMENRTAAVEADIEALKEQTETHGGQLTDIMLKLEDYENRQRRNNLRFMGIEEGVEGNDIRTYMVKLLQRAFPELNKWDWEIKERHRERMTKKFIPGVQGSVGKGASSRPGVMDVRSESKQERGRPQRSGKV
ncbi:hypothetical protein NDU88_005886 [Pleurodeles waltl]|uniref:Uncharacterized protein n=1 Tax=Pleurodeles waltl TaxID=8319 RepID=A0AAV7SMZ9_PLEWA|nr:hypothetical protein NDU88_005886 [Pleurodeles waltl]